MKKLITIVNNTNDEEITLVACKCGGTAKPVFSDVSYATMIYCESCGSSTGCFDPWEVNARKWNSYDLEVVKY